MTVQSTACVRSRDLKITITSVISTVSNSDVSQLERVVAIVPLFEFSARIQRMRVLFDGVRSCKNLENHCSFNPLPRRSAHAHKLSHTSLITCLCIAAQVDTGFAVEER